MKPAPHDNPDLTAYALGELEARQAREIHELLAACPVAAHELEQVEAVTDALRHGAPIPQERLLPEQRHAVLYPARLLPQRTATAVARTAPMGRTSRLWPVVTGVLKAAAVVTLAALAYLAGRHAELDSTGTAVAEAGSASTPVAQPQVEAQPLETAPADLASISVKQPQAPAATPPAPVSAPEVKPTLAATAPAIADAKVTPALPEKAPVVVVVDNASPTPAALAVAKLPGAQTAAPAAAAPRPGVMTTPSRAMAFVNASRQPVDQFGLEPALIRPLPPKLNKRDLLTAPAPRQTAPEPKDAGSKPRTPDLYIHSWRTESASCPWNDKHRLLRITIQLPADQPAATTEHSYPLRVAFDPNNVREYRQLCERHQPAAALRQAGMHEVWYEYLPNGEPDTNKTIATVTLDKGRFTTQTVGPFDSSKLYVQDRGGNWQQARQEFVFDSAVVGFGLLMRGVPQAEKLNHGLVLALAEKSKGKDPTGDCARFIRMVKEAASAAGL
ncbi:protein of unknown function [Prosthecobacter debontii]|uniref:Uncharacterized protein YfbK C-terminal domain-containing protein n=1 Tax=Prosthecobacter debontii TaxID=48467 RepID=A0A1T4WN04_9BACT|nr:YfbK domain-containing protein [Prosthecobacter debontii]SKA78255.1 protein of unknown function [Prosthecobacter debontii]